MSLKRLEDIFARRLEDVLKTSSKRLEDTLKTFVQEILQRFWRRLEDVLARRLQDIFKTSWRRLKNVLKRSWRFLEDIFSRHLENVLKTSWQEVLKTTRSHSPWGQHIRLDKDVLKTSSEKENKRRLQDVLKISSSRRMFTGELQILTGVLVGIVKTKKGKMTVYVAKKSMLSLGFFTTNKLSVP